MTHDPIDLTDATFGAEVLEAGTPVLVEFWATWSAPCTTLAPIIRDIAKHWTGKLPVVRLDIDNNFFTARKYQVLTIPTLILFREGKPLERIVGVVTKVEIDRRLRNALMSV